MSVPCPEVIESSKFGLSRLLLALAAALAGLSCALMILAAPLGALGPGYAVAVDALPGWLLAFAALLAGSGAAGACLRAILPLWTQRFWQTLSARMAVRDALPPKAWLPVVLGCLAVLAFWDLGSFRAGFFRLDDFEILRVAAGSDLLAQMARPHGDHTMPLYRLEVHALLRLCGPAPWAFNTANAAVCLAMLLAGCWLLSELGSSRAGLAVFVIVAWFWAGWGDFTSGYQVLSVYPQGVACGFCGAAALLRGLRTGRAPWVVLAVAAVAAAATIDVAGFWAIPSLLFFALAAPAAGAGQTRLRLAAAGSCPALALAVLLLHTRLSGAGLPVSVVGDCGQPVRHLVEAGARLWSGLSGAVILGAFAPLRPGSLHSHGLILWLEALALLGAAAACVWIRGRVSNPDLRLLGAIAATLLAAVGMVALARDTSEPGFFWPPKWTSIAHCWFSLAVAFCVDRLAFGIGREPTKPLQLLLATAVLWGGTLHLGAQLRLRMGGLEGRPANERLARARQADFERLVADLASLAAKAGVKPLELPGLQTEALHLAYPLLEGYALADLCAAIPKHRLDVVVGDHPLSPKLRQALEGSPSLAWLAATPLAADPSRRLPAPRNGL